MPLDLSLEIRDAYATTLGARLAYTRRAYAALPSLNHPALLDAGCGDGDPTIELARLGAGRVVGVDLDRAALARLSARAVTAGLGRRVHPVAASIAAMPFVDASFDLVWSEGCIRFIGFEMGLARWRRLVRPGGHLVVHDSVWPSDEPPAALRAFWGARYRGVRTAAAYKALIAAHGYELIDHFVLPGAMWRQLYFAPVAQRLAELRACRATAPTPLPLDGPRREIEWFERYPDWYSSAFFVMQRS